MNEITRLSDFVSQNQAEIEKAISYSAEHKGVLSRFVNRKTISGDRTSISFHKAYLPEVDRDSDEYKNGLVEGVTPPPSSLNLAEVSEPLVPWGDWIPYSDRLAEHAYGDLVDEARRSLANKASSYDDEKCTDAYLSSGNTITGFDPTDFADLVKIKTILQKNGAEPLNGFFIFVCSPDLGAVILNKHKDIITHTTRSEDVITGELGEIAGLRIVPSNAQALQGTLGDSKTTFPFIAFGMTTRGLFPVTAAGYGSKNARLIVKDPGELGGTDENGRPDALNQRGSIGIKIDGTGFYVNDDSAIVTGTCDVSETTVLTEKFDPSNTSKMSGIWQSPSGIYADVSHVAVKKGGTYTLSVKDSAGSAITNTASQSDKLKFKSLDEAIATVDSTGTITGVKDGITQIVIADATDGAKSTLVVVTVTR